VTEGTPHAAGKCQHTSRFPSRSGACYAAQVAPVTTPSRLLVLYLARGVRGFGDGFAIIILPAYLSALGFGPVEIGIAAAASLLGTAC
jgi:hypothetical protein